VRVLFLDIDGVLNSYPFRCGRQSRRMTDPCPDIVLGDAVGVDAEHLRSGWDDIDPEQVARLAGLLRAVPDCRIVLSSTWRKLYSLAEMRRLLRHRGLGDLADRLIDRTPDLTGPIGADGPWTTVTRIVQRGEEIADWLAKHPEVVGYVVLDDTDDMDAVRSRFVETWDQHGLTDADVDRAIGLLREPL
jgi:hypothetical protein